MQIYKMWNTFSTQIFMATTCPKCKKFIGLTPTSDKYVCEFLKENKLPKLCTKA